MVSYPDFLRDPGSSYEFVSWLRRFLDDNPSSAVDKLLKKPASVAGSGLQFNSGTYGPDNVGDYSSIESTGTIVADFTQPNGSANNETTASLGFNSANGTIFTQDPANAFGGLGAVVGVYQVSSSGAGASCLDIVAKDDASGGSGQVTAVSVTADSKSTTDLEGIVIVSSVRSPGSGDAYGIQATAANTGTGREIAALFSAGGHQTGANSLAILCETGIGAPIFEVRNDGSVHIKTGTAVIADL